ncbi:MAG: GAF domain-containing protein, partial [Deltaproteobacteria bacterium]
MPGVANKDEPKTGAMVSLDRQSMASSPVTERLRVLITDDNTINRKLLRVVLEAENQVVLEADNGISALQLLEQTQVDAIISDILMPEMDGYRLCYEIRKNPKLRTLPFIVYTASYTSPSDEKVALQFGVDKFLRKPASSEEIVKSLHEVLASAKLRARDDVQIPEEAEAMREYNQVLVRKLEDTIVDLSEANKSLAERSALAEFVATISTTLAEANGLREMLQRCCDAVVEHLGSAFARIWTLNEEKNLLEPQASSGMYTHIDWGHARVPVGQFEIGLVASERKPHLTNTVIGDPRVHDQEWAKREGLVAFAGYPLLIGDQLVGVMATFARKPFGQNTLDAMGSVARSIAVGIQRQLVEAEVNQNLDRIRALHEIDLAITSTLDLPTVLNVLLEKIDIFLPFPAATTIRLFNPVTGRFENTACRNLDEQEWKPGSGRGTGQLSSEFLKTKRPVIIPDIQTDPQKKTSEFFRKHGFVSYLGVPLIAKGNAVGILGFYTKEPHEFTQQEIDFLTTLAGQAAVAIHNARLYEETERRRREAEELARVARSLTENLDPTVVGERILTSVRDLFGVQGSTLRLRQADGSFQRLASSGDVFSQTSEGDTVPSGVGLTGRAIAEGNPVWSPDILNDAEIGLTAEMRDYQLRSGNRSMIIAPLRSHEKLIGTLALSDRTGRTFTDNEVALLQAFADQAALALENAQLYEQTERQLRRIEALREIEKSITSTLDLSTVLNVLMEKLDI